MNTNWRKMLKDGNKVFLAKQIGVSRQTIHNWVTGQYGPELKHARKISKILNIPLDSIV